MAVNGYAAAQDVEDLKTSTSALALTMGTRVGDLENSIDTFQATADGAVTAVNGLVGAVEAQVAVAAAYSADTTVDAAATAADRVQTGLDRIATAADRVVTTAQVAALGDVASFKNDTYATLYGCRYAYATIAEYTADPKAGAVDGDRAVIYSDPNPLNNVIFKRIAGTWVEQTALGLAFNALYVRERKPGNLSLDAVKHNLVWNSGYPNDTVYGGYTLAVDTQGTNNYNPSSSFFKATFNGQTRFDVNNANGLTAMYLGSNNNTFVGMGHNSDGVMTLFSKYDGLGNLGNMAFLGWAGAVGSVVEFNFTGTNRVHLHSAGAFVTSTQNGRNEREGYGAARINYVGYEIASSIGKTFDFNNSGQSAYPGQVVSISTVNSSQKLLQFCSLSGSTYTELGYVSGLGVLTLPGAVLSTVELGHATDTTLTRLSAGDVAVEGNRIFRSGGADVPVADGGTGASTPEGARVALGIGNSFKTTGNFPNPSYPAVSLPSGAAGNNDLYTVPTGRKAIVYALIYGNNSGAGTIVFTQQIKISGVYYKISVSTSAGSGALGGNIVMAVPILLNAGESYSINCDVAGLQVQGVEVLEFDSTSTLARAQLTSFSAGLNTLFTCPAGKTAALGVATIQGNASNVIAHCNQSGASRTIEMYRVPAAYTMVGTSADYPYLFFQAAAANNILSTRQLYSGMAAGDYISIKSDSAAAGQFAWLVYNLLG